MRELNIEQRLIQIDENIAVIKQILETLIAKPVTQPAINNDKAIMSVKQVAQLLGVDINIIYTKCAKGDIPYFKIGKQYRFKKEDILNWVKKQNECSEFSVDDYVNRYMQKHILKG
jgi:excisionase family DNA binding protein